MKTAIEPEFSGQFSSVLRRETELLTKIGSLQKQVWDTVLNRVWDDFETLLGHLNVLGNEFEALEQERKGLMTELTGDEARETEGFYHLTSRFSGQEGRDLAELYRSLKIETMRVRIANDNLLTYIGEAKTTVTGFLEAAFPDRRGKVYSRRGALIPADMRSMVLNQSF